MSQLHVAEIKHTHWSSDVYEPSDDTFLLVDALQEHAASWGTNRPRCPAAVDATRRTLAAHAVGLGQGVRVWEVTEVDVVACSLFGPLAERLQGAVDVLVFNPPYVPTPDEELPGLLSPRGELFMVTVTENDPAGIIAEMRPLGFQGRIAASRQADEETLSIVHLWRETGPGPCGPAS
ncbi:hypothetical protein GPECTOR_3g470 [Gonium pectorale]|uniref:Methyltransferase small domain-containing protein n=1 Tax=Gonium pectorale TaxID=33097 RepID=A0A150GZQ1_GONPE|nr:hypothetical protein GPECTOR_3g470 [Gonium pectorale]|eukprot:KXZ55339.1 hypothetical protein GPECTOR_3g470 [Gonium pectorale]